MADSWMLTDEQMYALLRREGFSTAAMRLVVSTALVQARAVIAEIERVYGHDYVTIGKIEVPAPPGTIHSRQCRLCQLKQEVENG